MGSSFNQLTYPTDQFHSVTSTHLINVPNITNWCERQIELGLDTVKQYEDAIQIFHDDANIEMGKCQENARSTDNAGKKKPTRIGRIWGDKVKTL